MMSFLLIVQLFISIFIGTIYGQFSTSEYESRARQYLNTYEQDVRAHMIELKKVFEVPKDEVNLMDIVDLIRGLQDVGHMSATLADNLKQLPYDRFQDELLKRQVLLSLNADFFRLSSRDIQNYYELQNDMKELTTKRNVCSRRQSRRCDLAYMPHLREIISHSKDATELEYYWIQWRNTNKEMAKESIREYIDLTRKISQLNGFSNTSAFWYDGFEDSNMINEFTEVMQAIRPLYLELHAYVRRVLQRKYGELVVPRHGAIPQHLLEQTLWQAWKKDSLLEQPYPAKKLPNIFEKLSQNNFTSFRLVHAGDDFYKSMGLPELPQSFWDSNVKPLSRSEAGRDCTADLIDFKSDVFLKFCPKPNYKRFLQMHGNMAQVRYAYMRSHLPLAFNEETCPGFSNAVGESAILASNTPKHLQRINLVPDYNYDEERDLNRIFRMGVHTLFNLHSFFVHEKLTVGMLDGSIPSHDYNCAYWDLMEQYAGVQPPVPRSNDEFDPSYKFYKNLDVDILHHVKLMSEILGYQIYKAFCSRVGEYIPGDPQHPLHNCDYSGNAYIGTLLKNVLSLGKQTNWREITKTITGTNKLSGDGIMAYYAPVMAWLQEQNRINNVRVGWIATTKCSRS